jgi:ubiquinone/menaquinone biosynthesis C-methylase UbiE
MDHADDAADYDAMDHRAVNQLFVADLLAAGLLDAAIPYLDDPSQRGYLPILDLGTGTAQIPILLVQQVPQAQIMAADAALEMLQLARLNIELAAVQDAIQLDQCDAKAMLYQQGMFAVVMSNSIVHHIPEPAIVFAEMVRVCHPDGLLFVRDLLRPETAEQVEQLVQQYAGQEVPHSQQLFRDSLHASLTLQEVRDIVNELGFAPETVQQTSDRHWTWVAWKRDQMLASTETNQ